MYSCRRMTASWPLVIFHNITHLSSYNAFVPWKDINPSWMPVLSGTGGGFPWNSREGIVTPLVRRRECLPCTEASASVVKAVHTAAMAARSGGDQPEYPANPAALPAVVGASKRKSCHICPPKKDSKTHTVCCRCNKYICKGCALAYCPLCGNRVWV